MDSSTRNGFRRAAAITARVMAMPSASWVGVFTANIVNMAARKPTIFTRGSSRCITECTGPLEDTAVAVTVAVTGPPDTGAAIGIRTTRSAICLASARSWVMMSTVTPRDLSVRNSSWMRSLAWTSRLAVGSSMMSTSGLQASTPAMATNRCCPPDRSKGERSARCPICSRSSDSRTRSATSASASPWLRGPYATSSATVSANNWCSGCCIT